MIELSKPDPVEVIPQFTEVQKLLIDNDDNQQLL